MTHRAALNDRICETNKSHAAELRNREPLRKKIPRIPKTFGDASPLMSLKRMKPQCAAESRFNGAKAVRFHHAMGNNLAKSS